MNSGNIINNPNIIKSNVCKFVGGSESTKTILEKINANRIHNYLWRSLAIYLFDIFKVRNNRESEATSNIK